MKKISLREIISRKILPSLSGRTRYNIIIDVPGHQREVTHRGLIALYDYRQHYHRDFEICVMLEGHAFINLNGKCCRMNEEDIAIIRPGVRHSELSRPGDRGYGICWFHMTSPRSYGHLDMHKGPEHSRTVDVIEMELPISLLTSLPELTGNSQPRKKHWLLQARGYFMNLFAVMADSVPWETASEGWHEKIIGHVMDYINRNYKRDFTREEIARELGFSPNYFSSLFKKHLGVSLVSYCNKLRVEKARQLLLQPNARIKEISNMLGFSDPYYFSVVFKKYTKLSPEQYRLKRR